MKTRLLLLSITALAIQATPISAQTTSVELSTRSIGAPPAHETVDSTRKWIENPLDQKLLITVTNLYADSGAYMEVIVAGQRHVFYGAGVDGFGNYIPTNYPPLVVNTVLRREYQMNIMCPNSGPNGTPFFKVGDLSPSDFLPLLTSANPDPVSLFLWTNFTAQGQFALTNSASTYELQQTNLVLEINRILSGPSIYNAQRFAGVTLQTNTTALLAQNPQGQQLIRLNRFLVHDAYPAFNLPAGQPDNSGTAEITFSVQPPPELKIQKNQPAPHYSVLLMPDTRVNDILNLVHPQDGNVSTNHCAIKVTQDRFARFGLGDGCDDATKAPGQGNWLSIGPGCTSDTNRIAANWSVSLGRTLDGLAAGQLAIREPGLTRDTYTPYALYYNAAWTNLYAELQLVPTNGLGTTFTNVCAPVVLVVTNIASVLTNSASQLYTNFDSLIRQVKAPQTFVDVLTPDTNQTVLNFYFSSQVGTNQDATGLYTAISGAPFVTWVVKNPEPATTDKLSIEEHRNGGVSTSSLVKSASSGNVTWTLTLGSGAATRVETRQVSFVGSPVTDRVELDKLSYAGSGAPAYQCQETYHFYDWGSELKETRIPANPDLVTTYDYYTDPGYAGYGQLKSIVYPDGYWEKREYDDAPAANEEWRWWGWGVSGYWPGLLRYVYYPYLDGRNGGATNVDDANQSNTTFTKFYYGGDGFVNVGGGAVPGWHARRAVKFDGFHGLSLEITSDLCETEHDANAEGDVMDSILNFQESEEFEWHGTRNGVYSDAAPVGLSGHYSYINYSLSPDQPSGQLFYYDHGVFNSAARTFTPNPTNHLYNGVVTNYYPDHRETRLVYPNLYFSDAGSDSFPNIEDHTSLWIPEFIPGYAVFLYPNQTRKYTRIYQGGNLSLSEEYSYVGQQGGAPNWVLLNQITYLVDSLGHVTNATRIDPVTQQTRVLYSADYRGGGGQDGQLLLSQTDEMGVTTSYQYDALQRVVTVTITGHGAQPDQIVHYVFDANGQPVSQSITAGSLSQTQSWAYDISGRLTNHVDQSGVSVSTTYSSNSRIQTDTYPGGITAINEQYLDGRQKSQQGSGVVAKFYDYDLRDGDVIGSPRAIQETITHLGHEGSPRWRTQGKDQYGLDAWSEWPLGGGTANTAWEARWNYFFGWPLWINRSAGFPSQKFSYNLDGSVNKVELTTDKSEDWIRLGNMPYWLLDFSVNDSSRVTLSDSSTIQMNGASYRATTNYACLADGSPARTVQGIHLEQLNGFQGAEIAKTVDYDADLSQTTCVTLLDRSNNKTTVVTGQPAVSRLSATNVYQSGLLVSSSTLSVARPTLYFYDSLGRTNRIQNPLGYSASICYDPATGWVTNITDYAGNPTSYAYYGINEANTGKLKCQTDANGKSTYYAYTTRGELFRTWGDVPYPAEYHYNEYGDPTNLVSFRGGSGWTSPTWPSNPGVGDNTYWAYDDASGALLQKTDAQGRAVTYAYNTTSGQLLTRSWQRVIGAAQVTVTNSCNDFGDLTRMDYNDGTPSVLFNQFDRAGKPREIIDASGTTEFVYDNAERMVNAGWTDGLLNGVSIANHFTPGIGRDLLTVSGAFSPLNTQFGFDDYGRLGTVASGIYSATYGYLPNSDLLQTTIYRSNTTTVLTTARGWEYGFRLSAVVNTVNDAVVTSHAYTHDSVNRRTRAALEDGSVWNYDYNDRNELTGARRQWPDFVPVAGQQFGYSYDNIGNRVTASFGGDTNGANIRTASYVANNLNQYTNINTPGYRDITGAALGGNAVSVNGAPADRRWEYFHRQIATTNANEPVWQNVEVACPSLTNRGGLLLPPQSQTLAYDLDGNLIFDGVWSYQWDAENRLKALIMTNVAGIANSNRLRLDFAYDYLGRRVQKVVSTWSGSAFANPVTNLFVNDGWNIAAVLSATGQVLSSYAWGQDLSGTLAGAGGVGGLLMVSIGNTEHFAGYDGNGNVVALINAVNKNVDARYDYSPFGETLRSTGTIASSNAVRFSTKFADTESGLLYYGSRYFAPSLGRWLSGDSSGLRGGINLYAFLANHPTVSIDSRGFAEHHVATMQLARSLPEGPGTDYLKRFTIPVSDPHYYDAAHRGYNVAVREFFDNWLAKNGITEAEFAKSAQLAEKFVQETMEQPATTKIGGFLRAGAGAAYWGGKALKAAAILGGAFGAAGAVYNAYAGGNELVAAAQIYRQDVERGADSATIDLDAINAAVAVQTMTGDYFVTVAVLDALLQ